MKTYYAAIPAKTVDEAVQALKAIEADIKDGEEVEIRQVVPIGQKALVIYLVYYKGAVR